MAAGALLRTMEKCTAGEGRKGHREYTSLRAYAPFPLLRAFVVFKKYNCTCTSAPNMNVYYHMHRRETEIWRRLILAVRSQKQTSGPFRPEKVQKGTANDS